MSGRTTVAFVLNLVQDVNIVRGLVYLAAREFDADILVLASEQFFKRDRSGRWERETEAMVADAGATLVRFAGTADLEEAYRGRRGIVFGASESDLLGHHETYLAHRHAPASFLRVTLQHGHECVGFLQNREHVIAHGQNVTFAADVIATWAEPAELDSTVASQRPKVAVTGPATLLHRVVPDADHLRVNDGLVCENLHSVRLRASGNHGASFLETFEAFCGELDRRGRGVTLRPHPSGKYLRQNRLELPSNVTLNDLPVYRIDLSQYAYGISAPSTVLLDMVLAGIPVAVWHDPAGIMDAGSYRGLTFVSRLDEWLAFERDARLHRERILARQQRFLSQSGLLADPADVYRRFARLIANGLALSAPPVVSEPAQCHLRWSPRPGKPAPSAATAWPSRPLRILFVAAMPLPTLDICFIVPLAEMAAAGEVHHETLAERDLDPSQDGGLGDPERRVAATFDAFAPDVVVFCRYGGPGAEAIVGEARKRGTAVVFHIDDDLLNVPATLGTKKQAFHMKPARQRTLRYLLANADLVYSSTEPLRNRLSALDFPTAPIANGAISCASDVIVPATLRPVTKIGYMGGGDHAHDLELALPDLAAFLERNEDVSFELFSSMPMPPVLARFGVRARRLPAIRSYHEFRRAFAALEWDIGLCPLKPVSFNICKTNTKWLEYTAVGTAVIASAGLAYDDCCADGCGLLVEGDRGWLDALEGLTLDPETRHAMVRRAQRRLSERYSVDRLRRQVLEVFSEAASLAAMRRHGTAQTHDRAAV